jgi:hypothetical protein
MADDAGQAAAQQADAAAVLSQHLFKVLESTMAEALQSLAVQVAVLAVDKAAEKRQQLKDIAGKFGGYQDHVQSPITVVSCLSQKNCLQLLASCSLRNCKVGGKHAGLQIKNSICSSIGAGCLHAAGFGKLLTEAIKHGMDQKASDNNKTEGVYHCVAGKSFASESHRWQPLAANVPVTATSSALTACTALEVLELNLYGLH